MRTKAIKTKVNSTKDCVDLLNTITPSHWKRKSKFNLTFKDKDPHVVRVFSDGLDTVSVILTEYETIICWIDLSAHKSTITEIQNYTKTIYTHDYGEVYFNPWDMTVYAVGGDGGIVSSTLPLSKIKKLVEDNDFAWGVDDVDFSHISGITDTIVEAECNPDEDEGFILVAIGNDIGMFM